MRAIASRLLSSDSGNAIKIFIKAEYHRFEKERHLESFTGHFKGMFLMRDFGNLFERRRRIQCGHGLIDSLQSRAERFEADIRSFNEDDHLVLRLNFEECLDLWGNRNLAPCIDTAVEPFHGDPPSLLPCDKGAGR